MELLLIRHGRVAEGKRAFNRDGRADPGLGEIGRDQAERLAERLASKEIDAIYVSGLVRTHETAEPLAASKGIEPVVREDLNEVYLGEYEGRSFAKLLKEADPTYLRFLVERTWETFPGAEKTNEVRDRVAAAVQEIVAAHPMGTVAVICHGGIINAALAIAVDSPRLVICSPENTSITGIYMRPGPPLVAFVNDASHLTPDRDPLMRRPVYSPRLSDRIDEGFPPGIR